MDGQSIAIIGAGGHAKVICDTLKLSLQKKGSGEVVGFVDDDPSLWGKVLSGLPILGPIEGIVDLDIDGVIVAIGGNKARKRVYEWAQSKEYDLTNAVHPTAVIADDVSIGEGVAIFANVVINPGSSIGNNVILNTGCTVDHDCSIGHHAHVGPGAHLAGGVEIAEGTFVGVGTSIIPYRKIGRWSIVGAGSVVVEDVPDQVTVTGLPAKKVVKGHFSG